MPYNANIPQAADQISVSQADILGNFQEINVYTAIDHEAFGLADAGKHKKATFPQHAAPGPVAATEVGLYAAALGGFPELYVNKTGSQVPMTASLKAAAGWTYLPSGILLQWGQGVCGGLVAFPIAFPTACLNVQVSPRVAGGTQDFVQVLNGSLTVANFTAMSYTRNGNLSGASIYFFAIGY